MNGAGRPQPGDSVSGAGSLHAVGTRPYTGRMDTQGQHASSSSSSFPSAQPSRNPLRQRYAHVSRPMEGESSRSGSERKRRHTGTSPERRYNPYQYSVAGPNQNQVAFLNNHDWSNAVMFPLSEGAADMARGPTTTTHFTGFSNFFDGASEELHSSQPSSNMSDYVPPWQPDATASDCNCCGIDFSFWLRRHHCRRCGHVVCSACSPHRILIPKQLIVQNPSRYDAEFVNGAGPVTGGEVVRVCNRCLPDGLMTGPTEHRRSLSGTTTAHEDQQLLPSEEHTTSLESSNNVSSEGTTTQGQLGQSSTQARLLQRPENLASINSLNASLHQQQPSTPSFAGSDNSSQHRYARSVDTGVFKMDESPNRPQFGRSFSQSRSASSSTLATNSSNAPSISILSTNPVGHAYAPPQMDDGGPAPGPNQDQATQVRPQPVPAAPRGERPSGLHQHALGHDHLFTQPVASSSVNPFRQPWPLPRAVPDNAPRSGLSTLPEASSSHNASGGSAAAPPGWTVPETARPYARPSQTHRPHPPGGFSASSRGRTAYHGVLPGSNIRQGPNRQVQVIQADPAATGAQPQSVVREGSASTQADGSPQAASQGVQLHSPAQSGVMQFGREPVRGPLHPAFSSIRQNNPDALPQTSHGRPAAPRQLPHARHQSAEQTHQAHSHPAAHDHRGRGRQHRRNVREEDECPVCGVELPPGEAVREQHVKLCIETRFSSPPAQTGPGSAPSNMLNNTNAGSSPPGGVPLPDAPTRPRAMSYRPRGMVVSKATAKDCTNTEGEEQECIICLESFEVGRELARMECLCIFHRGCIREWWMTKGRGSCPTHQLQE